MKTIAIPEDLHKEIMLLRLDQGNKNTAELIRELIKSYKWMKFVQISKDFKARMKERGLTFEKLLKESRKIREEVVNEQFPNLCD